jgi:hypothetical protein
LVADAEVTQIDADAGTGAEMVSAAAPLPTNALVIIALAI